MTALRVQSGGDGSDAIGVAFGSDLHPSSQQISDTLTPRATLGLIDISLHGKFKIKSFTADERGLTRKKHIRERFRLSQVLTNTEQA
jgi:hypothetical protein